MSDEATRRTKKAKTTPADDDVTEISPTRPLPTILNLIASKSNLQRSLVTLELEFLCTDSGKVMKIIQEDDLQGYSTTTNSSSDKQDTTKYDGSIYQALYSIFVTGSGGGFHVWFPPSSKETNTSTAPIGNDGNDGAVIYLGSEGERAKVGRTVVEFLQIFTSLAPHFFDAVGDLPGLNTMPDNGDITGATLKDFHLDTVCEKLETFKAQDKEDDDQDYKNAIEAANEILAVIKKPRLTIRQSLEALIAAHLSEPRFAIEADDDDNVDDVQGDDDDDDEEDDQDFDPEEGEQDEQKEDDDDGDQNNDDDQDDDDEPDEEDDEDDEE